ncbi:MAG: hypothetical protein ABI045_03930 [Flavobacteriales bacterium]
MSLIRKWGTLTDWCQTDDRYDIGTVVPKINKNHEVRYEVRKPAIWNFIIW